MKKEEAINFSRIIVKEKLGIEINAWDEFSKNALAEVFNIMVGNMTSAMSELFHKKIKIDTPQIYEVESKELDFYQNDEKLISIRFEIKLENMIKVNLVKIITEKQASEMIKMIKGDHHL
jgi:chemotaxis protein CheY-P-specific phosphatase CheC